MVMGHEPARAARWSLDKKTRNRLQHILCGNGKNGKGKGRNSSQQNSAKGKGSKGKSEATSSSSGVILFATVHADHLQLQDMYALSRINMRINKLIKCIESGFVKHCQKLLGFKMPPC